MVFATFMWKIFRHKNIVFFLPLFLWLLSQAFIFRPRLFFMALALGFLLIVLTIKGVDMRIAVYSDCP